MGFNENIKKYLAVSDICCNFTDRNGSLAKYNRNRTENIAVCAERNMRTE